jgi:hypothetical protein
MLVGGGRGRWRSAPSCSRMVTLIVHGLQTKNYEQFIASFSNPSAEPNVLERSSGKLHFQMRISPTCWYDAAASYPLFDETPRVVLQGGGDDFGVFITGSPHAGITADLHLASGQKAGRDARAWYAT